MKSDFQQRAEKVLARYEASPRKPIIFEFAGVPKAGKTSTIGQIHAFFKRCGFRVEVVVERASVCPVRDKKHFNFNVWTACTTLAQILEKTQDPPRADDPQILILDRGLFDSVCWLRMMQRLSRIRSLDRDVIERFLSITDWRSRITGVILMTVAPEIAMQREKGYLPVETTGSIMNHDVLKQMRDTVLETATEMKEKFRIVHVDTSSGDAKQASEIVADAMLNLIEEQIQEDILFVNKTTISSIFGKATSLIGKDAKEVLETFASAGQFLPREQVEADKSLVQALPVVVIRNKTGDVLRLRRREKDPENKLHEKLVIWAGGHVRKEDSTGGSPIIECAMRELQEELRLSTESSELKYIGSIYADQGGKTSQHVAIVFEWRAKSNDVEVTLSTAEFFERRGTSLSGRFVPINQLAMELEKEEAPEPWNFEIISRLLSESNSSSDQKLF